MDVPSNGLASQVLKNLVVLTPGRLCGSMDGSRDDITLWAMDAEVSVVRQRVGNIASCDASGWVLNRRRPLPVFVLEISMLGSMSLSANVYLNPLAGQAPAIGGLAARHASWVVLCGLLLVTHGGARDLGGCPVYGGCLLVEFSWPWKKI